MSIEKMEALKRRVQAHEARKQQGEGRRQSLVEQRARYVEELAKAGLAPEQLPEKIAELDGQAAAHVTQVEEALASVGA